MIGKVLGFFFDRALGKGALVFALIAGLVGWWQIDRSGQRAIGAAQATAASAQQETEILHDQLEHADAVRADALRAARGERVRNVKRDPYHHDAGR
ncbi:MAG TPA: hypothetical protein PLW75_01345 [Hyphomicrobium sp.]|nr:hypothetical protein [Hyphomicrobium sp.]